MPDESEPTRLELVARAMQRHGVEAVVIGGQAEALMGSPRPTYDVDLCHRQTPENNARVARMLADLHARPRDPIPGWPMTIDARTLQLGSNFTFECDIGPLDLLAQVEPIGNYDDLMKRSERYSLNDLEIRTIGLDDLIRVKQHIKRFKDTESLAQLLAIRQGRERSGEQ